MNISQIIARVAEYYRISTRELTLHRRDEPRATLRGVVMLVARHFEVSLDETARWLDLSDYSAVSGRLKFLRRRMEANAVLRADVEAIIQGKPFSAERFTVVQQFAKERAAAKERKLVEVRQLVSHSVPPEKRKGDLLRQHTPKSLCEPEVFVSPDGLPGWGSLAFLEKQLAEVVA